MTDWQPIETAPKDRYILVYPGIWTGVNCSVAEFDDNKYARKPRPYWRRLDTNSVTDSRSHPPSHWMPLPPAPIPLDQKEGTA